MSVRHLKIKIVSLAAEAKLIRAEERRVLRQRCRARAREVAKGLATGAEPVPPADSGFCPEFEGLRVHRRGVVGTTARHALLAYGFLRGTPYAAMEQTIDFRGLGSEPDFDTVAKNVERFVEGPPLYPTGGYGLSRPDCMSDARVHNSSQQAITRRQDTEQRHPEVFAWWVAHEARWEAWLAAAEAHLEAQREAAKAQRETRRAAETRRVIEPYRASRPIPVPTASPAPPELPTPGIFGRLADALRGST